jgi:hypothetical protein
MWREEDRTAHFALHDKDIQKELVRAKNKIPNGKVLACGRQMLSSHSLTPFSKGGRGGIWALTFGIAFALFFFHLNTEMFQCPLY